MNKNNRVIMTTAYFAPVQYYSKLASYNTVLIEKHENYTKQSYRNRCIILGANGPLTLSIPVKKGQSLKTCITDIIIDYDTPWQKLHQRAIMSAYRSSPYYEYYIDELSDFFHTKHKYLFDLNHLILEKIISQTGINADISFTDKYLSCYPDDTDDLRETIHPKDHFRKPDPDFIPREYKQVFSEKYGFISNLSILDLLFNTGPDIKELLAVSC